MRNTLLALALLAVSATSAQAIQYVDGAPLPAALSKEIRECRPSPALTLPVITWGADILTVQANGGVQTAKDSTFDKAGLRFTLKRQDNFAEQLKSYLNCDSPFLRATLGMAASAADITEKDPRTRMVALHQLSWSAGGDAVVVRGNITRFADLKGKTIALQKNGPHVDYLLTMLKDAGLTPADVTLKWTAELTGVDQNTPADALRQDKSVDAAVVILPDALALIGADPTQSRLDSVGTGAEGSVKDARVLISTKSANRIIADLYFVRADFLKANPEVAAKFVNGLVAAEEKTRTLLKGTGADVDRLAKTSAEILLGDAGMAADAKAMWFDAETVSAADAKKFFQDPAYPRGYARLSAEIQNNLRALGVLTDRYEFAHLNYNYGAVNDVATARFNQQSVEKAIKQKTAQGTIEDATRLQFEIHFKPNQTSFPADLYRDDFDKIIEAASKYAGAVISVEGHADPLGYIRDKEKGATAVDLKRKQQSILNLSRARANEVRDIIIAAAKEKGVTLDPTQFGTIGLGIDQPKTGRCGDDPCKPKTDAEWRSNMRVLFRIVAVEAEADSFDAAN